MRLGVANFPAKFQLIAICDVAAGQRVAELQLETGAGGDQGVVHVDRADEAAVFAVFAALVRQGGVFGARKPCTAASASHA